MADIWVNVNGSSGIATGGYVQAVSMSPTTSADVVPSGAPTPWNVGAQAVKCIAGADGVYEFNARTQWAASFSSWLTLRLLINGTTAVTLFNQQGDPGTSGVAMGGAAKVRLVENDTVILQARQFSGSQKTLNVYEFSAIWTRA